MCKALLGCAALVLICVSSAAAFIDSPHHPAERYTLSMVQHNAWIAALKVAKVDRDRGIVVYEVSQTLSGRGWPKTLKHLVKLDGQVPSGLRDVAEGQEALCFAWDRQFTLCVTFINDTWYLALVAREDRSWARLTGLRPDLDCLFLGKPRELFDALAALQAGREVIIRCQKDKDSPASHFVRCQPHKRERKQPVPALDAVAAKLPNDPRADPKAAIPALRAALHHDDRLVRQTAETWLRQLEPRKP